MDVWASLRALEATGFAPFVVAGVAIVVPCTCLGLYRLWYWYGPGHLERRKQERRQLLYKVRFDARPDAPDLPFRDSGPWQGTVPRKSSLGVPDWLPFLKGRQASRQEVDRDAYEREVRRWD